MDGLGGVICGAVWLLPMAMIKGAPSGPERALLMTCVRIPHGDRGMHACGDVTWVGDQRPQLEAMRVRADA